MYYFGTCVAFGGAHRTQLDAKLFEEKLQTNKEHNIMKKLTILSVLILFLSLAVRAKDEQNSHAIKVGIPFYSLVGVSSDAVITLQPSIPTEAGNGLDFAAESASNNSVWLNYSSVLKNKNQSNSISVSMDGDDLPDGVSIELAAAEDAGNGNGTVGITNTKTILLGSKSCDVVDGIGNCYTGAGSGSGHQLKYTLKMDQTSANYGALVSGDFSATITYTITEK